MARSSIFGNIDKHISIGNKGKIMEEFTFSESRIKRLNKLLFEFLVSGVVVIFGLSLILSKFNLIESLVCTGILYCFIAVFLVVRLPRDSKRQQAFKVILNEKEIVKHSDKEKAFRWEDITGIKVVKDVKGGIWSVKLWNKGKNTLSLYGFNEMERILNLIRERVPDKVSFNTVCQKFDWYNPFVVIPICWGISTVVLLIVILVGKQF